MTTISKDTIKGIARGLFSNLTSAAEEARADHSLQGRYVTKQYTHTQIGTNANLAESPFYAAKYAGTVLRGRFTPTANVAINTTNYVYVAIAKSVAGAATTLVGYLNTAVTAITKNVPATFTLNTNGNTFGADDVLTVAFTKYGNDATSSTSPTAATSVAEVGLDIEEGY